MNPDANDKPTTTMLTRFLRLFQKHEQQRGKRLQLATDHRKRGAATVKKHRRQMAAASRRKNRT